MKSSRSKRRRIIQSYVSPPRPDLPACFESLSDDPLTTVLEFVGDKSYRSFGGVNKHCKEVYLNTPGMTKETFLFGYGSLSRITDRIERVEQHNHNSWEVFHGVGVGIVCYNRRDVMDWALGEKDKQVLRGICHVAAKEERLDILAEVWYNVKYNEDNKEYIFRGVDGHAAEHGKLNVLKWLCAKGLSINEYCSRQAAEKGHIHIIQWLQEEKGLELDGNLYSDAIFGCQLNVMQWLREQEVDWNRFTFPYAAQKGNLDILQWLHDKGCPWSEDYRVSENDVKAEMREWLLANGYRGRLLID